MLSTAKSSLQLAQEELKEITQLSMGILIIA